MDGAKPERPRPFPSHNGPAIISTKPTATKRRVRGVSNSHEVGQQYTKIHPRLLMRDPNRFFNAFGRPRLCPWRVDKELTLLEGFQSDWHELLDTTPGWLPSLRPN
jgi:hypothetical protein